MKYGNNKVPNQFDVLVETIKEYGYRKTFDMYKDKFSTGDFLRALRISRSETQEYVAVRAEIDRTDLSRIERNMNPIGRHGYSLRSFRKLQKYYRID
jgi:DNA-binding XRE family transcriptional regulator